MCDECKIFYNDLTRTAHGTSLAPLWFLSNHLLCYKLCSKWRKSNILFFIYNVVFKLGSEVISYSARVLHVRKTNYLKRPEKKLNKYWSVDGVLMANTIFWVCSSYTCWTCCILISNSLFWNDVFDTGRVNRIPERCFTYQNLP